MLLATLVLDGTASDLEALLIDCEGNFHIISAIEYPMLQIGFFENDEDERHPTRKVKKIERSYPFFELEAYYRQRGTQRRRRAINEEFRVQIMAMRRAVELEKEDYRVMVTLYKETDDEGEIVYESDDFDD